MLVCYAMCISYDKQFELLLNKATGTLTSLINSTKVIITRNFEWAQTLITQNVQHRKLLVACQHIITLKIKPIPTELYNGYSLGRVLAFCVT